MFRKALSVMVLTLLGISGFPNKAITKEKPLTLTDTQGQNNTSRLREEKLRLVNELLALDEKINRELHLIGNYQMSWRQFFGLERIQLSQTHAYEELLSKSAELERRVMTFLGLLEDQGAESKGNDILLQRQQAIRDKLNSLASAITAEQNDLREGRFPWGTILTFILAMAGLYIAWKQYDIAQRAETIQNLLVTKVSKLALNVNVIPKSGEPTPGNPIQYFDIEYSVLNSGEKTAERFFYTILIPLDILEPGERKGLGDMSLLLDSELKHIDLQGTKYLMFSGKKLGPVFPTRKLRLGNLSLRHPVKEFTLYWKLVTDDGVFPPGDGLNEVPFRLQYPKS